MALGVCIWYHHLGNDGKNSGAQAASFWMDSNLFLDVVGVPLIALLLILACAGVFFVGRVLWRARARLLRVRLPRWGL